MIQMFISLKLRQQHFLLEELVKRDFKLKYKRTILGIFWSVLSPLFMLCVMALIFGHFFGRNTEHYIVYLFTGLIIFNYFTDATNEGMSSLMSNASIFSKIDVPKYLFLISKNVSSLINFCIIIVIYFIFMIFDDINFSWKFVLLFYPIGCLIIMNLGIGLILSALFVFFRDIQYLYRVFTQLIMYGSAIFYSIETFPERVQWIFYANPIFACIDYCRSIVLYNVIPDLWLHIILLVDSIFFLFVGLYIYKKYNYKFLYYV